MEMKRTMIAVMAALSLTALGCGDDDGGDPVDSGPGTDSGPPGDIDSGPPGDIDSGPPGDIDSGPPGDVDSGPPVGMGCAAMFADCDTFDDRTGGGAMNRTIQTVPMGITFAYEPKCIRVNVGQEVTIEASALHPLNGACGPDGMNPIVDGSITDQMVTFTAPGIYGFNCNNHGAPDGSGMAGAIEVVMP